MSLVVKGMVQVEGTTYRIVRIKRGHYKVVRVLDDASVGMFSVESSFEMAPEGIDEDLMREIARVVHQASELACVERFGCSASSPVAFRHCHRVEEKELGVTDGRWQPIESIGDRYRLRRLRRR